MLHQLVLPGACFELKALCAACFGKQRLAVSNTSAPWLLKAALLLPSTVWTSLGLGCNLQNHPSLRPARLLMAMSHRQCKDLCQASVTTALLVSHKMSRGFTACPHRCPNPRACTADRQALLLECSNSNHTNSTNITPPAAPITSPCYMASGFAVRDSTSFQVDQCTEGYRGHVCGKCQEGYGSVRPFRCRKCYTRGVLVFMYVIACVLLLGFMKLVCWATLRCPVGSTTATTAAQPAEFMRQLVLYVQYTLILASVQAADSWPASVAKPLEALAWLWSPASPHTLAPGCLAHPGSAVDGVATVVFFVLLPLVMLALLLLLEVVIRFVRDGRRYQLGLPYTPSTSTSSFKDQLIAASMVVIYFFLPSVVRSCFGLFACISIDHPAQPPNMPLAVGSFWVHDTEQLCFAGWHRRLAIGLGIPVLLFVCFVPGFILYKTLPNRARLQDSVWLQHYGFLVQDYKPGCRYWEAVVSAQTILLVAISVFSYTLGPFYQAVLMNVAVAVILLLLAVARPLAHKDTQRVALFSMGCLFLTSYSALAFVQMAGESSDSSLSLTSAEAGAIPTFMGVIVVVTNCVFLAWVLWKLVRSVEWKTQWQRMNTAGSAVLALVGTASRDLLASRGSRSLPSCAQGNQDRGPVREMRNAGAEVGALQDDLAVKLGSVGSGVRPIGALGGRDQQHNVLSGKPC